MYNSDTFDEIFATGDYNAIVKHIEEHGLNSGIMVSQWGVEEAIKKNPEILTQLKNWQRLKKLETV
jgi:hypothetical protein